MTLNREDFPEMTDDQWNAIGGEVDRRATQAASTAKRGLLTPEEAQSRTAEALEAERARLEASEAERLELDRKALADERNTLAIERRKLTATKKLNAAGLPEDKIDTLLPMFLGVEDKSLDTTLDTFISTYNDTVKASVDAEKQKLLGNAEPPNSPTGGAVDSNTIAAERIAAGDEVGAVDALLQSAGYNT